MRRQKDVLSIRRPGQPNSNVIDLAERRLAAEGQETPAAPSRLRLRLDMEHAKLAISTSLISVVVLVTFANNSLWSDGAAPAVAAIAATAHARNIASVSTTGVSESETNLARRLAASGLAEEDSVGHRPSTLDQLALGFLEGKYSLRLEHGKLQGLEFTSDAAAGESPKFVDRVRFLEQNRELLPVSFDRMAKASSDEPQTESYELLRDGVEAPLAKVEFRMDEAGRLLSMKVRLRRVAMN